MIKEADGDVALIATINETFNFDDVTEEGTKMSWEKATFSELPLAGVIPFLTDLQSRVRRTESKVADHLYSQIDANTLKFDNVKAVVMPTNGTYIQQGDFYEADVFLAAYDNSRNPQFSGIPVKEVKEGVGKVSIQGTGNGEVKKMVTISLPGGDKTYQAEIKYTVSPPSSVISPTKMNVFYRNVENPLEVSVPGVAPSSLRVSGPGISGKNGNYIADVTKVEGKTMMVTVSVEENGKVRKVGTKEFRIKGLPMASGMVFRKSSGVMSTSSLAKAPIEAEYVDFPFELPLKVVSAEVKIEGQPPIQVKGSTFDGNTRELIQRLKPGASVTIRKIVATTPNGSRVSNVGNISIDVQ
jgi:gliding motility-associated protein GldM